MALATTPIDLTLQLGARFYKKFLWKDKASGDPIDLTGYKAHMQVRDSANSDTALLTLSTEVLDPVAEGVITLGGAAGTIELEILVTALPAIDWKNATYDLLVFTDADHADVLFGGKILVEKINTRV